MAAMLAQILVGTLAGKIADVLANSKKGVTPAPQMIASAVVERVMADPKIKNEMNAEPLIQSRVVNGTIAAAVMAAGVVYTKWKAGEYDEVFFLSLGTVITAGYAFLGRVGNWSKPMWSRVLGK